MFTKTFNEHDSVGCSITTKKDGFTITACIERDSDMAPPWKEHDGHGVVSDWRPKDSKQPSERILHEDGGSCRFYDIQASIKKAKEECWDAKPYGTGTRGERAARAVEADFQHLRAWCKDEWCWCVVDLAVSKNGIVLDHCAASLGGIESTAGEYFTEVANDLLDDAVEVGHKAMAMLNGAV